MTREALSPGQVGAIGVSRLAADGTVMAADDPRRPAKFQARAYYGRGDGGRGRKAAVGTSKQLAVRALRSNIAHAVQQETEAAADVARGETIPRDWTPFVERYRAHLTSEDCDLSDATVEAYRGAIDRHMLNGCPFDGRRLDSITHADLRAWLQGVANARGDGAAHTLKSVTGRMLKLALQSGIIPANPLSGMGKVGRSKRTTSRLRQEREREAAESGTVHVERDRVRALSAEDYERLVTFLDAPAPERTGPGRPSVQRRDVADLVKTMLSTGARISEALALRWADVDLDGPNPSVTFCGTLVRRTGEGVVRQDHTKRGASEDGGRTVYLSEETADLLRARRERDESFGGTTANRVGAVFPSAAGTWWDRSNASKRIRAILDDEAVGLSWASSHSLRRTFVSDLLDAGLPLRSVASAVGHRLVSTTEKHYVDTQSAARDTGSVLSAHRAARKVAN